MVGHFIIKHIHNLNTYKYNESVFNEAVNALFSTKNAFTLIHMLYQSD